MSESVFVVHPEPQMLVALPLHAIDAVAAAEEVPEGSLAVAWFRRALANEPCMHWPGVDYLPAGGPPELMRIFPLPLARVIYGATMTLGDWNAVTVDPLRIAYLATCEGPGHPVVGTLLALLPPGAPVDEEPAEPWQGDPPPIAARGLPLGEVIRLATDRRRGDNLQAEALDILGAVLTGTGEPKGDRILRRALGEAA